MAKSGWRSELCAERLCVIMFLGADFGPTDFNGPIRISEPGNMARAALVRRLLCSMIGWTRVAEGHGFCFVLDDL